MKKILSLAIVLTALLSFGPAYRTTLAANPVVESNIVLQEGIIAEKPVVVAEKPEYILPYPGILSDHPLYFLKKFRDSVLEMLIADPTRKIEFYILQSDKEISSTDFLSTKGKKSHIPGAVSRAIEFKEKAIQRAKDIKSQGKQVPGYLVERLVNSTTKQQDMMISLQSAVESSDVSSISDGLKKISSILIDIDTLK